MENILTDFITNTCERIADGFDIRETRNDEVFVKTLFKDVYGDNIEIKVKKQNGKYFLSDNGKTNCFTLNYMTHKYRQLDASKRMKIISKCYGLDHDGFELYTECDKNNICEKFINMIQMLLVCSGMTLE